MKRKPLRVSSHLKIAWCVAAPSAGFYVVDDHPGHRDPRKMLGSLLEANVHVIMASTMELRQHGHRRHQIQSHLSVDETVFEAFAACYAAGLPENRPEGVALLDIGAHSSELVVYFGNALQLAATIGLSGDHFTNDIAHYLRIGFADAQDIKEQFGSVLPDSTTESSFIELPTREGQGQRDGSRWKINLTGVAGLRAHQIICAGRAGTRARRHGPCPGRRTGADRRRLHAAWPGGNGGAGIAVSIMARPAPRYRGLAGRIERSRVGYGGGTREVLRTSADAGRFGKAIDRAIRENSAVGQKRLSRK